MTFGPELVWRVPTAALWLCVLLRSIPVLAVTFSFVVVVTAPAEPSRNSPAVMSVTVGALRLPSIARLP